MSENIYSELRKFMDTMPSGFPETPTGVEIKILRKLFSPEQAKLTMQLKKDPEEVSIIAKRINHDESELSQKLEELAQKGLIYRVKRDGIIFYQAFQFVVGVYEFQVNNLDKEFCELFEEYLPYLGMSLASVKTSQMRVIPVGSAFTPKSTVATYNKVRDLVMDQENICVSECICSQEQEDRCIGCGLCVSTCPEEAISLLEKPNMEEPAITFSDT